LADRLSDLGHDTSYSRVSHWETGRNRPDLQDPAFRRAFAIALELPESDLLRRLGFDMAAAEHSVEGEQAATLIDRMDEDMRRKAVKMLELLLT